MEDGITITVVDPSQVEWIRAKVREGSFVSEADVVQHGIEVLRDEDSEFETWMRTVVADRYDRSVLHPESSISSEEVVRRLEERRRIRAQGSR